MGFFKKIFKPVRKVLDKVIPNEIKPFLPYAAAAVPFLAPTSGIFGTMAGRAALSGGANLFSQLAQEGTTEDDLNLLSTGIAALSGALTAGRPDQFVGPAEKGFMIEGSPSAADFFKTKAAGMDEGILKSATNLLGTGASKVQGMGEVLRTDPFSKAGLKAATLPLATGTGDAMYAESVRLNKQQIIDDALAGLEEGATDAMRGDAIRLAMLQYGFSEDEIAETIASAGYKAGGRVGFDRGGLGALGRMMAPKDYETFKEKSKDLDLMTIKATLNQVHTNNDDGEGGGMAAVIEFMEKNPEYKVQVMENIIGDQGNKIMVAPIEETPVNILDSMNTDSMSIKDGVLVIDNSMFEKKAKGGRVGFKDGSSTGNFGADRYASELLEAYKGILDKGDIFYTDAEKELIEKGEYPSQDKMKEFQERYDNLEKEYEKEEDKFGNLNLQDALLDKDAIKFYNKKAKDLEDREEKLMDKEEKLNEIMYTDLDVSGILRTPEFQEWYRLWKVNDPKADDLPGADYFEDMMFNIKRLKPEARAKYNFADGGLMNLGGKEMDLRGGGFVPIGKKERADDVPARLSKNEFVMTADAVRAAGGGSVNKGAKRMYELMNNLEARV
jgi:hypothetical protein